MSIKKRPLAGQKIYTERTHMLQGTVIEADGKECRYKRIDGSYDKICWRLRIDDDWQYNQMYYWR